MLAVTGNIYIQQQQIQIKEIEKGAYFSFIGLSKHPREDKRCAHSISIFIPKNKVETAKRIIVPGTMLLLRHADLDGHQPIPGGQITATVKTNWNWIEILTRTPRKEKQ